MYHRKIVWLWGPIPTLFEFSVSFLRFSHPIFLSCSPLSACSDPGLKMAKGITKINLKLSSLLLLEIFPWIPVLLSLCENLGEAGKTRVHTSVTIPVLLFSCSEWPLFVERLQMAFEQPNSFYCYFKDKALRTLMVKIKTGGGKLRVKHKISNGKTQ